MGIPEVAEFVAAAVTTGALEGLGDRVTERVLRAREWLPTALRNAGKGTDVLDRARQSPDDEDKLALLTTELIRLASRDRRFRAELEREYRELQAMIKVSGRGPVIISMGSNARFELHGVRRGQERSSGEQLEGGEGSGQDYGPVWPQLMEAVDWTLERMARRGAHRLFRRPWQVLGDRWSLAISTRGKVLLGALAVVLAMVQVILAIPLSSLLTLAVPWKLFAIRRSPGAFAAATILSLVIGLVLSGLLGSLFSSSRSVREQGLSAETCDIRRMATGAGEYSSFTIPAGSPGFDLAVETSAGSITIRPDFKHMACAAMAMRELAESGFYRGRMCDRLSYSLLDCYVGEPKNRDYGFRVSSRQNSVPYVSFSREGTVLLAVDPQDRWVTGLLSFICSTDNAAGGVRPLAPFGQVTEGINLLNAVADGGSYQKDVLSESVASKPLQIIDVKVIPWPGASTSAETPSTSSSS